MLSSPQDMRGCVELAIRRLAERFPFHARVLERFELEPAPDVGTMGVAVRGDNVVLVYAPDFVQNTPLDQLGGVLLHEVHHVVFGHILADPNEFPDEWARTVAEEVTVNEFVTQPLPGNPVRLEQFPELPPMEGTKERYQRLKRIKNRVDLTSLAANGSGREAGCMSGAEHAGQAIQSQKTRKPATKATATVVDNHAIWHDVRRDPGRSAAAVRATLHDAIVAAGIDSVPDNLRDTIKSLGIGRLPGEVDQRLGSHPRGQLDWTHLLRRYVGTHLKVEPDFRRPPRRNPELVGIVPGRSRRSARPRIMAVIDTSASITTELLDLINAELARLAADFEVLVVECDTTIQRAYEYRRIDAVRGGGGTDFRPPFSVKFLRSHRPDLVIYFTDGAGPAPTQPPRVRVVWCLTPRGTRPAPWGKEIPMFPPDGSNDG